MLLELPDIHPDARQQRQPIVVGPDHIVAQCSADRPEDVAEVLARGIRGALGPEKPQQPVARLRTIGQGQIGQQSDRLGGRQFDGITVPLEARDTEKSESQR